MEFPGAGAGSKRRKCARNVPAGLELLQLSPREGGSGQRRWPPEALVIFSSAPSASGPSAEKTLPPVRAWGPSPHEVPSPRPRAEAWPSLCRPGTPRHASPLQGRLPAALCSAEPPDPRPQPWPQRHPSAGAPQTRPCWPQRARPASPRVWAAAVGPRSGRQRRAGLVGPGEGYKWPPPGWASAQKGHGVLLRPMGAQGPPHLPRPPGPAPRRCRRPGQEVLGGGC